jgi:predicted unusual protein kinase regulating ubiquinone biosynthesis (AarF/ABC1/UbiB family)
VRWRRLLAVGAFGATAAAVATAASRRRATSSNGPVSRTGRGARSVELARVGSVAGGQYAVHRARRAFASAGERERLDAEFELRTAEQVAAALGNMKGALMKLGQMASYVDQGLPEPIREALAALQQDAPPMSAELAAGVVERELGAPPDQLFEEWDPEPIAAASIGQVHRAITKDGVAVAVKVQYPGVDDAIRADLDNSEMLFQLMGLLFKGLDPGPLVDELRTRLLEELDYRQEAANQRLFVDYYAGHPFIEVPRVVDALSSGRVLTTELAEGARFSEFEQWSQDERDLGAEAIYRFVFRSLYRLHAFNGDPHPGNYLFRPGGRVTFLDFGLVKHFTADEIGVLISMMQAMVFERDPRRYRELLETDGLLRAGAPVTDAQVQDYFGHFYEMVFDDRVLTITPTWSSDSVRRYFEPKGEFEEVMRHTNLTPSWAVLQRINLGLWAVIGHLRATANWRRVAEELWPWVEGPPSTPLGEEEAAWRARTGR